jgi:DOPA 4,5-dioxygenase
MHRAPYHAHVYYELASRDAAERLHRRLKSEKGRGDFKGVVFVGEMRDANLGPHPKPQFEVHFYDDAWPRIVQVLKAAGLQALVHPLTDDDLADHTSLATWIGEPVILDQSVLDPPGRNQGIARFGKSDF